MLTDIGDVMLCTARAHCRRAGLVGAFIFGACGLEVHMHPVDTDEIVPNESWLRCVRDVIRACCWITFGVDFAGVAAWVHSRRGEDSREWSSSEEGRASLQDLRERLLECAADGGARKKRD